MNLTDRFLERPTETLHELLRQRVAQYHSDYAAVKALHELSARRYPESPFPEKSLATWVAVAKGMEYALARTRGPNFENGVRLFALLARSE